jgi:hypothetical protein
MDDTFEAMLDAVARSQQTTVLPLDSAVQDRCLQIVTSVGRMLAPWENADEAQIQRAAGSSPRIRETMSVHCGEAEYAIVVLWRHCDAVIGGSSLHQTRLRQEMTAAHQRGVGSRNKLPVATWARRLATGAAALCELLPWGPERTPTQVEASQERAGKMLLVLDQLQERLSAYTHLCGADLAACTRDLATVVDATPRG